MTARKKKIIFKCLIILFTYLLIELCCLIMIHGGYIPAKSPTFHFVWKNPEYPLPMADIDTNWGAWHYPEPFRSQNGCIYFDYRINSYGARDRERDKESADSERVIVLGDSFLEGWGIEEPERLSNILEQKTGHEFLNFSCADFGTTQEYLIYKHLASRFDHDAILIGFLPFNDFENDDKSFWENQNRYRPFFMKTDTGYRLEYYKSSLEQSALNKKFYHSASNSFKERAARFLRSFTYWFNIVDYVKNAKAQKTFFSFKKNEVVSYYYDYTAAQIDRLRFVLTQLRSAAPNKRIIFCSIPIIPDLYRRTSGGEPPLPAELKKLCDPLQIEYVDLLPYFFKQKDYRNFFFFCDTHWNEKANLYASEILLPLFSQKRHAVYPDK